MNKIFLIHFIFFNYQADKKGKKAVAADSDSDEDDDDDQLQKFLDGEDIDTDDNDDSFKLNASAEDDDRYVESFLCEISFNLS